MAGELFCSSINLNLDSMHIKRSVGVETLIEHIKDVVSIMY